MGCVIDYVPWKLYVNVREKGLVGNDSTNDAMALNAYITSIGSTPTDLFFYPGTYKLSSDVTIPDNVRIIMANGAMFRIDSGKTLTINGDISAGFYQIFAVSGTVTGTPKVDAGFPEWFGATGLANDTVALSNTLNLFECVKSSQKLTLLVDNITLTRKNIIDRLKLKFIGANSGLSFFNINSASASSTIKNCTFDADNKTINALDIESVNHVKIEKNEFKNFGHSTFNNVRAIIVSGSCLNTVIDTNYIHDVVGDSVVRAIIVSNFRDNNVSPRHTQIINNTIESVSGNADADGIYFDIVGTADLNSMVTGNHLINCKKRFIKIIGNGCVVSNNIMRSDLTTSEFAAISIYGSNILVNGNKINKEDTADACIEYGISFFGTNIKITNNICKNSATFTNYASIGDAIRVETLAGGDNNILISGNSFNIARSFIKASVASMENVQISNNNFGNATQHTISLATTGDLKNVNISNNIGGTTGGSYRFVSLSSSGGSVANNCIIGNISASTSIYGTYKEPGIWTAYGNMRVDGGFVPSYDQGRYYGRQDTAPGSGTWGVGDIMYKASPAAGNFIGNICTTAGTPGTWKTFGAISS